MAHLREIQTFIDTPIGSAFERIAPFMDIWNVFGPAPAVPVGYQIPVGAQLPRDLVPEVYVQPTEPAALEQPVAPGGVQTVSPAAAAVIDPEYAPTTTVYEDAPGGIYETTRAPTDWGAVWEQYQVLNPDAPPEVATQQEDQVIDWGQVAGTIIGGYLDPFGAGQATTDFFGMAQPMAAIPGPVSRAGPAGQVKIDPKTGRLVKCRRRRRRRLLTDGDFNDLMRISTLPNKDIVKIALAKAVGR